MGSKEDILERTRENARENGYHVCPDGSLLNDLVDGLAANQERYGYLSCPCRLAAGIKTYDADIICPCEYRDADCAEFGMCFCGLFVTDEIANDPSKLGSIPERRPLEVIDAAADARDRAEARDNGETGDNGKTAQTEAMEPEDDHRHVQVGVDENGIPVWRCEVCGYLAARETPPSVCPICKAPAERFARFGMGSVG